jgi:hypothetical protein
LTGSNPWQADYANIHGEYVQEDLAAVRLSDYKIPLEDNFFLAKMFGSDALGRLPTAGQDRICRTMLGLIGRNTET